MSSILGIEQHRCVEIREQTLSLPVGLLLGRHWGVCVPIGTLWGTESWLEFPFTICLSSPSWLLLVRYMELRSKSQCLRAWCMVNELLMAFRWTGRDRGVVTRRQQKVQEWLSESKEEGHAPIAGAA